ncbi:glycosyltransferase family 2 protein [Mycoplasmatota bacterium]|nr:glycosyltransferase family 2 protein [Mycoplasmatota bacterium]
MIELIISLYVISAILIVLLIFAIFLQKIYLLRIERTEPIIRNHVFDKLNHLPTKPINFSEKRLFRSLQLIEDQIQLSGKDRDMLLEEVFTDKYIKKIKKGTKSLFSFKRLISAYQLSYCIDSADELKHLIQIEKNDVVLYYLFYFSIKHMNQGIYDEVIKKLNFISDPILNRFSVLFVNHYDIFKKYLSQNIKDLNYPLLYIHLKVSINHASCQLPTHTRDYIQSLVGKNNISDKENKIRDLGLKLMVKRKDSFLLRREVISHNQLSVKKYAYQLLASLKTLRSIDQLFDALNDDVENNQLIVQSILEVLNESSMFNKLFYYYKRFTAGIKRRTLAKLVSDKINYLILRLNTKDDEIAKENIKLIIEYKYFAGIIAFINNNNNIDLERTLFKLLKPVLSKDESVQDEFRIYVKANILANYGYDPLIIKPTPKEKQPRELSKVIWLSIMFIIAIALYPILSIITQWPNIENITLLEFLKNMVLDTNRNLIYYFILANLIYLMLLIISLRGSYKQKYLWRIKSQSMLYETDLLPAISIIAPAYNEQVNIITSVKSLLNLKYPEYEVVVVNDGSKDDTLRVLIDYFKLKRHNYNILPHLKTKEVRGVYINPEYPNLVVVNKANGGKADALNVGINVAKHPYICGIDADSVLEQDALLRLMSTSLDHKDQPVALGGNIVPANGCVIDHGYVEEKHFPKENLTRFQALEYLRAFTTGRIGWSEIKSLLIISGAFGLFYKEDIVNIGGYITSSGELKKDSVGEDMELVVRLTINRMKKGKKQYIGYVYHANCYTELPSELSTLLSQRNRWHRGLIDILSYHRRVFMNPRYKQIGLIATPYFYIFEVLGPFFEWIGYTMLVISLIFGFASPIIVIGVFGLSVVLGMIISLFSLFIEESQSTFTTRKESFYLLLFAILENFGYRQMLSLHRIYSFFTALFEKGKWGEQKRKGI